MWYPNQFANAGPTAFGLTIQGPKRFKSTTSKDKTTRVRVVGIVRIA